jgi:hypothetical protein
LVRASIASQIKSTCWAQRSRVRSSSSCRCGRCRWLKERSCKVCACFPARVNQVVIVAGPKPKTREAAEGSSPSESRRQHDGDPAREGVFSRYNGVSRRALNVVRQARPRNVWMCPALPCVPSPTRACSRASVLPKEEHCRFGQANPSVGMRMAGSPSAFHLTPGTYRRRWLHTRRGRGGETTGGAIVWAAGLEETRHRDALGISP